ncbi:MAG: hypothetical protein KC978_22950, partial [Candidatus Omnitrophica bacterium]|nr:hypothetical protein [Candidatus Omnitrophota bacterium]
MRISIFSLFLFPILLANSEFCEGKVTVLSAPANSLYTRIDPDGTTIIPNGRFVRPLGKTVRVAPHPFGLELSRDGNTAITANSGVDPLSISIIRNLQSDQPEIEQIPPGPTTDEGVLASVFMGLAIADDNKTVYVAAGQENAIAIMDIEAGTRTGSISCADPDHPDGYIGDLVLSKDGKLIYAVDQTNFRVVIADTESHAVVESVPVGRYPFGIALSPDEKKVYVANVGMFEYKKIPGVDENNMVHSGLEFPPFGYNSKEMREGTRVGEYDVPGLGDPNVPESFSVWTIDLTSSPSKVIAKIKTGHLVGDLIEGIPAVGGSSPNSVVATQDYVFVSNGNNDSISVIDLANNELLQEVYLKPHPAIKQFRGVIPFGVAASPDGKRLFVAESGINAIGVIDIPTLSVIGHLPVGWFPSKLKVTGDGKQLVVSNAKGFGSGPNGGSTFQR